MIDTIIPILLFIGAVISAAGAFLGYRKGKKDADTDHAVKGYNEYIAARKRMDEVDAPSDDDVSEWLRERGGKPERDL